jgi:hypothetical protein
MTVLLVVDRANTGTGIWGMIWTSEDHDPRLLESKHFLGEGALKVWLAGISTRYGRSNITFQCTDSVNADDHLAAVIRESLDVSAARP